MTFLHFLKEEGLVSASPAVDQCEIGYINHIGKGVWNSFSEAPKVLRFLARDFALPDLTQVESSSFAAQFPLGANDANPPSKTWGRLYVNFDSAIQRESGQEIFVLNLLVRGVLGSAGADEVIGFFDRGRQVIVRNFRNMTAEAMHKAWGLQ